MKIGITKMIMILFFLIPVLIVPVFANDSMKIAVHDYIPYYKKDNSGDIKGMMIDVYRAASAEAGIKVEFIELPVKRGINYLFNNKVDAFSPGHIFMNPAQRAECSIVKTFNVVTAFFYHDPDKNKKVVFNSMSDLKGKKLGTIINSPMRPLFKKYALTWEEKQDPETLLRMLYNGRIEFSEMTLLSGLIVAKQLFKDKSSEFSYIINFPVECSLCFSNANPKSNILMTKFKQGLEKIKKKGEYICILEKYWGKGNIQKEALSEDLIQFGVDKTNFSVFSRYKRDLWGKIQE